MSYFCKHIWPWGFNMLIKVHVATNPFNNNMEKSTNVERHNK